MSQLDVSPLSPVAVREELANETARDRVFALLLRGIRHRASYAALLTVSRGVVRGRFAAYGNELDRSIADVEIDVAAVPALAEVIDSGEAVVGPIATGDAEVDADLERLFGMLPPSALLLPISLRGRVVAIAVGHRAVKPIGRDDVREIVEIAGAVAAAISRLILLAKGIEAPALPTPEPATSMEAEEPAESLEARAARLEQEQEWEALREVTLEQIDLASSDAERVALYSRLGTVLGDKLGRAEDAIDAWSRACEHDPENLDALLALSELERNTQAYHGLADTLTRLATAGKVSGRLARDQLIEVYVELARTSDEQLAESDDAVAAWREVLSLEPDNQTALTSLGQLLTAEERWADAVELFVDWAERLGDDDEAAAALIRAAELLENKIGDRAGAAAAYEKARALAPGDPVVGERLTELHRDLGAWAELVDVLLERADVADDPVTRSAFLAEVAAIYEAELGEPASAYMVLQTALRDDPQSDAIAGSLERLAEGLNNWSELMADETARAEALEDSDPGAAAELWVRIADGTINQLGNLDNAIVAARRALALDDEHPAALMALTGLYTRAEDWVGLVGTLRVRADIETDADDRLELLLAIGDSFESRLDDPQQAIEAFERALDEDSTCILALVSLERLLKREEQWQRVIEVLDRLVELRESTDERVRLRLEIGDIMNRHLGDPSGAIASFQRVLDLDGGNLEALGALETLYEQSNQQERYMEILEARLESTPNAAERAGLYERLASVWEAEFDRPERAAACLEKLVELEPEEQGRYQKLVRIYSDLGQWSEVLETYAGQLEHASDDKTRLDIRAAMADVYERGLENRELAIRCLHEMLEIDSGDPRALGTLARIYDDSGDWQRSVDVRMLFLESASDVDLQVELLSRLGEITFHKLGDTNQGLYFLNRALALDEDHLPSLEVLVEVREKRQDWVRAAEAAERAASVATGDQCVRLHIRAGRLFADQLDDSEAAIEHFAAAFSLDGRCAEAAGPLADLLVARQDWERLKPVADFLLTVATEEKWPAPQRAVAAYRAGLCARHDGDSDRALTCLDAACRLDSTSIDALRARADLRFDLESWVTAAADYRAILVQQNDAAAAAPIYMRLAETHQRLGDTRRAVDMLSRCLSVDPEHGAALEAMLELRSSMGDYEGVIESLRSQLEGTEGSDRAERLQAIGDIYRDRLKNVQKALAHYREALELVPRDHRLLQKTLDLYTESKQWKHAVDVIEQFLAIEDQPLRRASYFLAAASISLEELKDRQSAAAYLEQALDCSFEAGDELTDAAYQRALETFRSLDEIYTMEKEWKAQEQAYRRMIKRVGARDIAVSAALWQSLGEVYRSRLKHVESALESFELAHKLEPSAERASIIAELCLRSDSDDPDRAADRLAEVIAANPGALDAYRALFSLCLDAGKHDAAWCVASALVHLEAADTKTRNYQQQHRPGGLVPTHQKLSGELWARLSHPDENRFISAIYATIWSAVASVSAQPRKAFGLKRKDQLALDDENHPVSAIVSYATQLLDVMPTDVFVQPDESGDLMIANCIEKQSLAPALVARRGFLEHKKREGTFLAAKLLSFLRPERFLKLVLPTNKERRTVLFSAIALCHPEFPVPAKDRQAVESFLPRFEGHVSTPMREELGEIVARLISTSPKLDVNRWAHGADATAHRLGLLVCGDLAAAARSIANEPQLVGGPTTAEKIERLVAFSISRDYFDARDQLELSIV